MSGQIIAHEDHLTVDVDFMDLKDYFNAFRKSIRYREEHDFGREEILVICDTEDCIEYQTKEGDSFIGTYDPVNKTITFRVFIYTEDKVLKPIYITNYREYQVACDFVRKIMEDKLNLKGEWIA